MKQSLGERLPTLSEIIHDYGPFLGLVLSIVIVILILQFLWFKRVLKVKDGEIKRLADNVKELNDRYLHMIDEATGYKKREKN